ncbi:glutamine-rich protein 2 [Alligator mississippiensis]|uniref:Glutamine-rich protein 2 n=1 Tax=Alligator mississippiensis TaxID=8496 RepID=A0A151N352_ALLMI|nr:glutamine-rich protein 2 [Alligator mississippiensis]
MAQISLSKLADLSIGTPETGHVNFTALHTLLHAIIKHLNLQDLQTEMREEPAPPPDKGQPRQAAPLYANLEKKVAGVEAQVQDVVGQLQGLEKQLSALEKLPSGLDLLERAKSGAQNGSAVADMWQMMQMRKRIEANENGISKSMSLLQDLLNEVNGVKMAQAYTDNKIKKIKEKLGWLNPQEVDSQLQVCFMDQKNLNTDLKSLEQRLSLYPSPEELSNLVRWEILEDCLVTNKGKTPPSASQSVETIIGQTSLTRHPASPEQKDKLGATVSFLRESSASSSTTSRYSETMEALRQMGQLANLYAALKEQVNQLEETKCTYSDLNKLKQLLLDAARKNVPSLPAAVLDQLSSLKDMAEDMRSTKEKDEELLNRIQSTIINVQEDCEKLNTITGNLIEEHRQKQKDIDVLFQSLEKLEKEKADKEHLEMEIDVKADKIALASKVSRSQFDATLEQLNKMIQDLLNKMTGHEQDWHKVLDKLVVEMDSKLDRLELDPFREQLEERWKAIRKQLKEKSPQYEADEAAGIRKRLLAHFHCISCDRPLDMVVPGPTITRIPSVPMLPTHRSVRPYTVYELEQVRQQCRSDKMAEMECGYLSVPRHCGGSHTITYPYRHYTRLQQIAHCMPGHPGETTMLAVMKRDEVDILGLDGHIYKGRMETRLPSISGKNGPLKTKSKLSQSSFQKQSAVMDVDSFPGRPQSAKLSSLSNTARSLKDRPVSSQGRLSQTSLIHPPSPTQPQEERDDFPMQEKETLEFQLTVPMGQQTDEQAAPFQ